MHAQLNVYQMYQSICLDSLSTQTISSVGSAYTCTWTVGVKWFRSTKGIYSINKPLISPADCNMTEKYNTARLRDDSE